MTVSFKQPDGSISVENTASHLTQRSFILAQDEVEFAGFEITNDTVCTCKKFLMAFPTPKNITDVRSWFGLVNQISYAFSMAERMLLFWDLFKPATPFRWDDSLGQLFEESKTAIITEIANGVKIFDKTKSTCLATGWSRHSIGFWLFQNTVRTHQLTSFAVDMDGKSPVDSPTLRNVAMHQLKERLWP